MMMLLLPTLLGCGHILDFHPAPASPEDTDATDTGPTDTAPTDTADTVPVDTPAIDVTSSLSFGSIYEGCTRTSELTVENVGTADLTVTALTLTGGTELSIDPSTRGDLPWVLVPGEVVTLPATYAPTDVGVDSATLAVESDDPLTPSTATNLSGEGLVTEGATDHFDVDSTGTVDILLVLDNSGSMAEEYARFSAAANVLLSTLDAASIDYHIGILTTDASWFTTPVIDTTTADATATLEAATLVGTLGSGDEGPLEMAYLATDIGGDAGPGSTFLRDTASLEVLFWSDEEEEGKRPAADSVARLWGLKSNPGLVRASGIVGDPSTGCSTGEVPGVMLDAITLTGGAWYSICDATYDAHLAAFATTAAAGWLRYALSAEPAVDSIVVAIDGVAVTTGWTYDATTGEVVFTTAPAAGSDVDIRYDLAAYACP